jgi:tRNA(Arg) A34 adenosine deaminase TadA
MDEPQAQLDERYMRLAIDAAHIAEENGDVPIGAVIASSSTTRPPTPRSSP